MAGQQERRLGAQQHRANLELHAVRAALPDATKGDITGVFDNFNQYFAELNQNPYYRYTRAPSTIPSDARPMIPPEYLKIFYPSAKAVVGRFVDAQYDLQDWGRGRLARPPGDTYEETGSFLLDRSYALVAAYNQFLEIPASTGHMKQMDVASGRQKAQFTRFNKEIGRNKPEAVRETLRRHIPRWLTHPIDPLEAEGDTTWISYTPREAHYLISPENINAGQAPLEIALKSADAADATGKVDAGYAMRTHAVLTVLEMEKDFADLETNAEVSFFTHVVGAALATENHPKPKGKQYDYGSAITETMRQTFQRFQEQRPESITFLEGLADHYREDFPDLLAKSVLRADRTYDEIDVIDVIRGLAAHGSTWATDTARKIEEAPHRRVLRDTEIGELTSGLPAIPESGIMDAEAFIDDTSLLLGNADLLSFHHRLPKIEGDKDAFSYSVGIELDRISETIGADISFTDSIGTRHLPIRLSFSGEAESLQVETLEQGTVDESQSDALRSVVGSVIKYHADKIRKKKEGKTGTPTKEIDTDTPAAPLVIHDLTREQRLERYSQQRAGAKRKQSTLQAAVETATVSGEDTFVDNQAERTGITIPNLTPATVQEFLADENIQAISSDELTTKVMRMVTYADINKSILGKRVNLDSVGPEADGINLRQINVDTNGGRNAIRIYVEDIGDGEFQLRGVHLKRNRNQQSKYIKKLVGRILQERAALPAEQYA